MLNPGQEAITAAELARLHVEMRESGNVPESVRALVATRTVHQSYAYNEIDVEQLIRGRIFSQGGLTPNTVYLLHEPQVDRLWPALGKKVRAFVIPTPLSLSRAQTVQSRVQYPTLEHLFSVKQDLPDAQKIIQFLQANTPLLKNLKARYDLLARFEQDAVDWIYHHLPPTCQNKRALNQALLYLKKTRFSFSEQPVYAQTLVPELAGLVETMDERAALGFKILFPSVDAQGHWFLGEVKVHIQRAGNTLTIKLNFLAHDTLRAGRQWSVSLARRIARTLAHDLRAELNKPYENDHYQVIVDSQKILQSPYSANHRGEQSSTGPQVVYELEKRLLDQDLVRSGELRDHMRTLRLVQMHQLLLAASERVTDVQKLQFAESALTPRLRRRLSTRRRSRVVTVQGPNLYHRGTVDVREELFFEPEAFDINMPRESVAFIQCRTAANPDARLSPPPTRRADFAQLKVETQLEHQLKRAAIAYYQKTQVFTAGEQQEYLPNALYLDDIHWETNNLLSALYQDPMKTVAVIGGSGTGKTTLLRSVLTNWVQCSPQWVNAAQAEEEPAPVASTFDYVFSVSAQKLSQAQHGELSQWILHSMFDDQALQQKFFGHSRAARARYGQAPIESTLQRILSMPGRRVLILLDDLSSLQPQLSEVLVNGLSNRLSPAAQCLRQLLNLDTAQAGVQVLVTSKTDLRTRFTDFFMPYTFQLSGLSREQVTNVLHQDLDNQTVTDILTFVREHPSLQTLCSLPMVVSEIKEIQLRQRVGQTQSLDLVSTMLCAYRAILKVMANRDETYQEPITSMPASIRALQSHYKVELAVVKQICWEALSTETSAANKQIFQEVRIKRIIEAQIKELRSDKAASQIYANLLSVEFFLSTRAGCWRFGTGQTYQVDLPLAPLFAAWHMVESTHCHSEMSSPPGQDKQLHPGFKWLKANKYHATESLVVTIIFGLCCRALDTLEHLPHIVPTPSLIQLWETILHGRPDIGLSATRFRTLLSVLDASSSSLMAAKPRSVSDCQHELIAHIKRLFTGASHTHNEKTLQNALMMQTISALRAYPNHAEAVFTFTNRSETPLILIELANLMQSADTRFLIRQLLAALRDQPWFAVFAEELRHYFMQKNMNEFANYLIGQAQVILAGQQVDEPEFDRDLIKFQMQHFFWLRESQFINRELAVNDAFAVFAKHNPQIENINDLNFLFWLIRTELTDSYLVQAIFHQILRLSLPPEHDLVEVGDAPRVGNIELNDPRLPMLAKKQLFHRLFSSPQYYQWAGLGIRPGQAFLALVQPNRFYTWLNWLQTFNSQDRLHLLPALLSCLPHLESQGVLRERLTQILINTYQARRQDFFSMFSMLSRNQQFEWLLSKIEHIYARTSQLNDEARTVQLTALLRLEASRQALYKSASQIDFDLYFLDRFMTRPIWREHFVYHLPIVQRCFDALAERPLVIEGLVEGILEIFKFVPDTLTSKLGITDARAVIAEQKKLRQLRRQALTLSKQLGPESHRHLAKVLGAFLIDLAGRINNATDAEIRLGKLVMARLIEVGYAHIRQLKQAQEPNYALVLKTIHICFVKLIQLAADAPKVCRLSQHIPLFFDYHRLREHVGDGPVELIFPLVLSDNDAANIPNFPACFSPLCRGEPELQNVQLAQLMSGRLNPPLNTENDADVEPGVAMERMGLIAAEEAVNEDNDFKNMRALQVLTMRTDHPETGQRLKTFVSTSPTTKYFRNVEFLLTNTRTQPISEQSIDAIIDLFKAHNAFFRDRRNFQNQCKDFIREVFPLSISHQHALAGVLRKAIHTHTLLAELIVHMVAGFQCFDSELLSKIMPIFVSEGHYAAFIKVFSEVNCHNVYYFHVVRLGLNSKNSTDRLLAAKAFSQNLHQSLVIESLYEKVCKYQQKNMPDSTAKLFLTRNEQQLFNQILQLPNLNQHLDAENATQTQYCAFAEQVLETVSEQISQVWQSFAKNFSLASPAYQRELFELANTRVFRQVNALPLYSALCDHLQYSEGESDNESITDADRAFRRDFLNSFNFLKIDSDELYQLLFARVSILNSRGVTLCKNLKRNLQTLKPHQVSPFLTALLVRHWDFVFGPSPRGLGVTLDVRVQEKIHRQRFASPHVALSSLGKAPSLMDMASLFHSQGALQHILKNLLQLSLLQGAACTFGRQQFVWATAQETRRYTLPVALLAEWIRAYVTGSAAVWRNIHDTADVCKLEARLKSEEAANRTQNPLSSLRKMTQRQEPMDDILKATRGLSDVTTARDQKVLRFGRPLVTLAAARRDDVVDYGAHLFIVTERKTNQSDEVILQKTELVNVGPPGNKRVSIRSLTMDFLTSSRCNPLFMPVDRVLTPLKVVEYLPGMMHLPADEILILPQAVYDRLKQKQSPLLVEDRYMVFLGNHGVRSSTKLATALINALFAKKIRAQGEPTEALTLQQQDNLSLSDYVGSTWQISEAEMTKLSQIFASERTRHLEYSKFSGSLLSRILHGKRRDVYQCVVWAVEQLTKLENPTINADLGKRSWKGWLFKLMFFDSVAHYAALSADLRDGGKRAMQKVFRWIRQGEIIPLRRKYKSNHPAILMNRAYLAKMFKAEQRLTMYTPLMVACIHGQHQIARWLIEHCKVEVNMTVECDGELLTALDCCYQFCEEGASKAALLRLLVEVHKAEHGSALTALSESPNLDG